MSSLTDEFADVIAELSDELGEGLTATLVVPQEVVDPETGAMTSLGSDLSYVFACPPPQKRRIAPIDGAPEVVSDQKRLVMPRVLNSSGGLVTPARGQWVRIGAASHQILEVAPVNVGDDVAGFILTLVR